MHLSMSMAINGKVPCLHPHNQKSLSNVIVITHSTFCFCRACPSSIFLNCIVEVYDKSFPVFRTWNKHKHEIAQANIAVYYALVV